jgi:hypothetical protein
MSATGNVIIKDLIHPVFAPFGAGVEISFNLVSAPHVSPNGEKHDAPNFVAVFSPPLFEIAFFAGLFVHSFNNFIVHFFIPLFFSFCSYSIT